MNTFGRFLRVSIFGESHGPQIGVVMDGVPAGLPLQSADLAADLGRRKAGAKGTTARKEADEPVFLSGVFEGRTNGAPLAIVFANRDVDPSAYERMKETPRPGHADLVARQKFGAFNDHRGGGHFSGRLTAVIVAAGAVAKKMIAPARIGAQVISAGGAEGAKEMEARIEAAMKEGDSVGGIVECRAGGLPPGLGEPFFDSAESLLSHAAFSIPAVKGIEFGAGFRSAAMKGSECNDDILNAQGKTDTNNSGGINGGLTNGNELVFRIAVKPTSSIRKEKLTVNMETGDPELISVQGRHDSCIALRVPVILEAMTALVLADLMIMEDKIPRIWGE